MSIGSLDICLIEIRLSIWCVDSNFIEFRGSCFNRLKHRTSNAPPPIVRSFLPTKYAWSSACNLLLAIILHIAVTSIGHRSGIVSSSAFSCATFRLYAITSSLISSAWAATSRALGNTFWKSGTRRLLYLRHIHFTPYKYSPWTTLDTFVLEPNRCPGPYTSFSIGPPRCSAMSASRRVAEILFSNKVIFIFYLKVSRKGFHTSYVINCFNEF